MRIGERMSPISATANADDPDPDADWSLPGWIYTDPEFFAVEMDR